jgi:hypothetical protein
MDTFDVNYELGQQTAAESCHCHTKTEGIFIELRYELVRRPNCVTVYNDC